MHYKMCIVAYRFEKCYAFPFSQKLVMMGFLKPKNLIVWFSVLIKVPINSDSVQKKQKQWWPKFPAEWLQHIESYYDI